MTSLAALVFVIGVLGAFALYVVYFSGSI